MKKLNLLLGILIGITFLACSSDDGNSNNPEPDESIIVYKKASSFYNSTLSSFQEIFFNTDGKIQQIVTDIDNGWRVTTINIIYNGTTVSEITKTIDFGNSNDNTIEQYTVTSSNNQIKLTGMNGIDQEIQIDFTNNYVDGYREITLSNLAINQEEFFTRNSSNNLTTHSGVGDSGSITFEYSNYDMGNVMPFHREYSIDYFLIFGLRVSDKLPLTEVYNENGNSDTFTIDSSLLTYDNVNNIIIHGDNINYTEYEYITQ